jgi:hypothetical protein
MTRTIRPSRGFVHEPGWESNEDYEWYTPPFIFENLNTEFDLDPCSPGKDKCIVPAKTHYTFPVNNGLIDPWFGLVFCNPPYGRHVDKWLKRCIEHNNGIALIFSRTSTRWFQSTAPTTSTICFINKRLKFISGKTGELGDSAGADSMLMAWGSKAKDILVKSNMGVMVTVND